MRKCVILLLLFAGSVPSVAAETPESAKPGRMTQVVRWFDHSFRGGDSDVKTANASEPEKLSAMPTTTQIEPAITSETELLSTETRARRGNYLSAEFLYWETNDLTDRGPLANQTTFTIPSGGSLGFETLTLTTGSTDNHDEPGLRLLAGHWFNDLLAVEIGGFWLNPNEFTNRFVSFPTQTQFGTSVSQSVSLPNGESVSSAQFNLESETGGIEANARLLLINSGRLNVDGLAGLRWLGHDETFHSLVIQTNSVAIREAFAADNNLVGGQIGTEAWFSLSQYVSLRIGSRIGFMSNNQEVRITGPTAVPGKFTGAGNQGTVERSEFATLFDAGLGVVWHLTPHLRAQAGYNAIWVSDAVRATDQIDVANIGGAHGLFLINDELWFSGFNVGIELAY